jgi:hypothetical protein
MNVKKLIGLEALIAGKSPAESTLVYRSPWTMKVAGFQAGRVQHNINKSLIDWPA